MKRTSTYFPKNGEISDNWRVFDAEGQTLGRLARNVAVALQGKDKPTYTPHVITGDHVVIVNAEKIKVTGHKEEQKVYYHHTGYPGGIRATPYSKMKTARPARIIHKAVWGMLPHNTLGRQMIKKLRVYAGGEHRHQAQQLEVLEI